MDNTKTWVWLACAASALLAGCLFEWHAHDLPWNAALPFCLAALALIVPVFAAYLLGGRHVADIWERSMQAEDVHADRRRAAFLAIAKAAHDALMRLDDRYRNTFEHQMQLRAVYQSDASAALAEALASIPVHELPTVEAMVALAGLKRNMAEAMRDLDQLLALKNKPCIDASEPLFEADLRGYKANADLHYRNFTQALGMPARVE